MSDLERSGVRLQRAATFGAVWEAELAVARLEAAGIPAVVRGNDIVGIFGPNFMGRTARGVDVLVPSEAVPAAREILSERAPAADE